MPKLISVDMQAQFGFLKKPDINTGENPKRALYLTYNMLHKPALLGILGAILGLDGYSIEGAMKPDDIPEYRQRLRDLKVAIEPIKSSNGNFSKQVIKFTNTVGYASEEQGGVLIVDEQTLIKPCYRVFLHLEMENDDHKNLFEKLKNQEAEYIPYLGKNDHQLWWDKDTFTEWTIVDDNYKPSDYFKIASVFQKLPEERIKREERQRGLGGMTFGSFVYFERIPVGWHSELPHYQLQEFIFTDFPVSPENNFENLLKIKNKKEEIVIQIF